MVYEKSEWKIRGAELIANKILIGDLLMFLNLSGDFKQNYERIIVRITGVDVE